MVELKLKKAQSVAMGLKFTGNSAELGGGMYVDNTTLNCEGQMSFVATQQVEMVEGSLHCSALSSVMETLPLRIIL